MRKKLGSLLLAMTLMLSGVSHADAYMTKFKPVQGDNGTQVCYFNNKSDILVIGASNVAQMYNAKCKASYVACWGGHYGYGTQNGKCYRIDSSYRLSQVRKMVKKKKNLKVFIYASTNDYTSGSGYRGPVNCMLNVAKNVRGYSKNVKVYCCSMIGVKGANVSAFNKYLKGRLSKLKAIGYCDCTIKNVKYQSDGDHYEDVSTQAIFKKIKATAKRVK